MTRLNPYLSFKGQAREAMEFYKSVFGGNLTISTFKEANAPVDPSEGDLIMHAQLDGENGIVFMGSDVPEHMPFESGKNISMSLSGDDEVLLKGWWDKLSVGATIEQPLVKAPWGDIFGMLADKVGIRWMVNISPKKV